MSSNPGTALKELEGEKLIEIEKIKRRAFKYIPLWPVQVGFFFAMLLVFIYVNQPYKYIKMCLGLILCSSVFIYIEQLIRKIQAISDWIQQLNSRP